MWAPLVMTRGDDRTFTVTLTDQDGALDLTDAAVSFSVGSLFSKTVGNGVTIDADPTTGICTVAVAAADTAGVSGRQVYDFDVQVILASGATKTPIRGRFVIVPDVTE